ncbi:MAG: electron transfer flavoprotein subunit beta/FixA family protein [Bacteroidetes bacterium]|nr:MAG: electron transfer flavoprotein subunit beta/FixA family protein [Bacteroidota bacterium]
MNIIVPIKQVPDLVEELEIDSSGKDLDREWLKFKVNEYDDHALEEALLLKEEFGGTVTAIALDGNDIDKALYAAAAKGADKVVKVTGLDAHVSNHQAARALANVIQGMGADLVFTGVQSVEDRDGQLGVLLAHYLNMPHISVVTGVTVAGSNVVVKKEYSGGIYAEFEAATPIVLGIQAARETPRYVPVAKVRRAMSSTEMEEVSAGDVSVSAGSSVSRMFKPVSGGKAEMLSGSAEDVAGKLVEIIKSKS